MFKIMIKLDEEIFKECGYPYLKGGYFECNHLIIFKLINKRFASGTKIYNHMGIFKVNSKMVSLFTHSRFFKGKYGYKDKVPTIGITGFRIWDDKYFGASSPSY
ncbi:hypothetical protein [Vallitalea guaymasensis]|uniref:hypothetical protein n=1 Tax=Vallitalea guaymasensis TaxID=1185412 RepID=UPI002355EF10|nr:hypothetical protein [Vallitalea guaymasensis]